MTLYHSTLFNGNEVLEAHSDKLPDPWVDAEGNIRQIGVGINIRELDKVVIAIRECDGECGLDG